VSGSVPSLALAHFLLSLSARGPVTSYIYPLDPTCIYPLDPTNLQLVAYLELKARFHQHQADFDPSFQRGGPNCPASVSAVQPTPHGTHSARHEVAKSPRPVSPSQSTQSTTPLALFVQLLQMQAALLLAMQQLLLVPIDDAAGELGVTSDGGAYTSTLDDSFDGDGDGDDDDGAGTGGQMVMEVNVNGQVTKTTLDQMGRMNTLGAIDSRHKQARTAAAAAAAAAGDAPGTERTAAALAAAAAADKFAITAQGAFLTLAEESLALYRCAVESMHRAELQAPSVSKSAAALPSGSPSSSLSWVGAGEWAPSVASADRVSDPYIA
jgi:hypothetical protein